MSEPRATETRDPDWELLERNVIERLHAIRDAWPVIKGTPLEEQLGVPVLRLLAEFCACVELGEIEG